MGELHIVPLARQAVAILRELEALTSFGEYVFPSLLTLTRPMSNNTVNTALRRLGYTKEQMTGHGFRSIASTLLNEQGFPPDVLNCSWRTLSAARSGRPTTFGFHIPFPIVGLD
jgi:integrase